jgi:hypothetical protein
MKCVFNLVLLFHSRAKEKDINKGFNCIYTFMLPYGRVVRHF